MFESTVMPRNSLQEETESCRNAIFSQTPSRVKGWDTQSMCQWHAGLSNSPARWFLKHFRSLIVQVARHWIAPCRRGAIWKCTCWTFRARWQVRPPACGSPQRMTDPSCRIAANALLVAWICSTFLSWSWTLELSPPADRSPHATTDPSCRIAANALLVARICSTFLSWSCLHQLLDRPMQWLIHLAGLQQMLYLWPEYAPHFWADLGLWSCHRRSFALAR